MAETDPVTVDINGFKYVFASDFKLVTLSQAIGAAAVTLHDSVDNTDYQVPTGKLFIALAVTFNGGSSATVFDLWSSDNANTADGTNVMVDFSVVANVIVASLPIKINFVADQFVTGESTSAASSMVIIGIEMDA